MKTLTKLSLFLLAVLTLSSTSCRKHKLDKNGLPPATQEGKNTLGFLLNGEPWTPKGFNGTANLSLDYDPGYKEGIFNIATYRIIADNDREYFGLGIADSLNHMSIPITLPIGKNTLSGVYFSNSICTYDYFDTTIYRSGSLTITKLDANSERVIISGKFNATLYKSGCDTIKITGGRFDMKLQ